MLCCSFALRACTSALSSDAQSSRWPRQALLARPAIQHGNPDLVTPPPSLNLALALCSMMGPRAPAACFRSLTRAKATACSCHNGSGMLKLKLCPLGAASPLISCASLLLAGSCAGARAFLGALGLLLHVFCASHCRTQAGHCSHRVPKCCWAGARLSNAACYPARHWPGSKHRQAPPLS